MTDAEDEKGREALERVLAYRGSIYTEVVAARAYVDNLEAKLAEAQAENDDLKSVAADCTDKDHQPYCRHYKGLKQRNAALLAERDRLRELERLVRNYLLRRRQYLNSHDAEDGTYFEMIEAHRALLANLDGGKGDRDA